MLFIYSFPDESSQSRMYTTTGSNKYYQAYSTNSDETITMPNVFCSTRTLVEHEDLTPPRSGSSTSSIEFGASSGGMGKGNVSLGIQRLKNIPEPIPERRSSTNINSKDPNTVLDTQNPNTAKCVFSCDRNDQKKNNKTEQ